MVQAKKEFSHVVDFEWKSSNFYALPKIHKSNQMINKLRHCDSEYIEMSIPSGLQAQPVVAGPVSPTQHLSEFLSEFLENSVSNSRTLKFIYKRRLELPHKIPKVHSFGS